ncbi:head maturation protease, ClpP-related [Anaerotalea alkaliphila]|nr:head maturation protease, ClpP-related [Anaerotalea alkaliphila]
MQVESETSADHFRSELGKYPDVNQINLYVNSFGGSVFEAMAIRSQLKRHAATVTGYVDGFACSAASFVLTACDKVVMPSNTMQMIHNAWNYVAGNAKELRKAADDLEKIMEGNRQAYLEKSAGKITEEKLMELLDSESWLTAAECLEYGLADEVTLGEVDLTNAKAMLEQRNKTLEQKINYNKALAAQIRAMQEPSVQEPKPQASEPEPSPAPSPESEPENKAKKLMAALFRQ